MPSEKVFVYLAPEQKRALRQRPSTYAAALLSAKSSPIVDSVVCVLTLLVAFALIEEGIDDTAEDEECKMRKKQTTR